MKSTRLFSFHLMPRWRTIPLVALLAFADPGSALAQAGVHQLPLWEVKSPTGTVYLLGSVHMLRPEAYPLNPAIYKAFDAAKSVTFELDLQEAMSAAPLMLARGMYPLGRTLKDELPPDLYADLEEKLKGLGLPIQALQQMKPWLLGLTLTSLVTQQAGYTPELGVDFHFDQRARAAGKTVKGLESMDEQIAVFDGLDREGQIDFLRSTLEELENVTSEMNELTEAWTSGKVERMAEMVQESMGQEPEVLERVLYGRNRAWVPQIESLLREGGTSLVIVGLGHLVGERSVIDLLGERGYAVQRLNDSAVIP
jgi:uncharacterized protein